MFFFHVYEAGFLHRFDPTARVTENPSLDLENEFRRKIRIIVLGMRGCLAVPHLWVPWKHPGFVFQNLSHKVFRWLVPFALLGLWITSAFSQAARGRTQVIIHTRLLHHREPGWTDGLADGQPPLWGLGSARAARLKSE